MTSFTKYTPIDVSTLQAVTDITEKLFCGPAVAPIFIAIVQDGGLWADEFDELMRTLVGDLPHHLTDIVPSNMVHILEDDDVFEGIAAAISSYVRSVIAYKAALAADAQDVELMSFEQCKGDGVSAAPKHHTSTKRPAPRFALDPATAEELIGAYEGLTMEHCNSIICHELYQMLISEMLSAVLTTYQQRLEVAIGTQVYCTAKGQYMHGDVLDDWIQKLAATPPSLITFTPYDPRKHSGVWSSLKAKVGEPQILPGFCRVQWACHPLTPPCDVPMRVVQATKNAIATAPKVPYLASRWASGSLPLFIRDPWPERLYRHGEH